MREERLKEMKQDALSIAASISDKGYTVDEMMMIVGYLQSLSKQIMDTAMSRAATKDCFPDAARLKSYF